MLKPMLTGTAVAAVLFAAPVMAQTTMGQDGMSQGTINQGTMDQGSMGYGTSESYGATGQGGGVTMTDPVSTNWADNWTINSGQQTPGTTGMPQGTYGSTGGMDQGAMGSGSSMTGQLGTGQPGTASSRVMMDVRDDASLQERRGRGQNTTELTQTSLLNSFSSAGFMGVRNFHKDGDRYVAEAQQRDGSWTMVELDPRTGTIRSVR